jgi:hypothetical protein
VTGGRKSEELKTSGVTIGLTKERPLETNCAEANGVIGIDRIALKRKIQLLRLTLTTGLHVIRDLCRKNEVTNRSG